MKRIIIIGAVATFMLLVGVGIGNKDSKTQPAPAATTAATPKPERARANAGVETSPEPTESAADFRRVVAEISVARDPHTCDTLREGLIVFGPAEAEQAFGAGYTKPDLHQMFLAMREVCGL